MPDLAAASMAMASSGPTSPRGTSPRAASPRLSLPISAASAASALFHAGSGSAGSPTSSSSAVNRPTPSHSSALFWPAVAPRSQSPAGKSPLSQGCGNFAVEHLDMEDKRKTMRLRPTERTSRAFRFSFGGSPSPDRKTIAFAAAPVYPSSAAAAAAAAPALRCRSPQQAKLQLPLPAPAAGSPSLGRKPLENLPAGKSTQKLRTLENRTRRVSGPGSRATSPRGASPRRSLSPRHASGRLPAGAEEEDAFMFLKDPSSSPPALSAEEAAQLARAVEEAAASEAIWEASATSGGAGWGGRSPRSSRSPRLSGASAAAAVPFSPRASESLWRETIAPRSVDGNMAVSSSSATIKRSPHSQSNTSVGLVMNPRVFPTALAMQTRPTARSIRELTSELSKDHSKDIMKSARSSPAALGQTTGGTPIGGFMLPQAGTSPLPTPRITVGRRSSTKSTASTAVPSLTGSPALSARQVQPRVPLFAATLSNSSNPMKVGSAAAALVKKALPDEEKPKPEGSASGARASASASASASAAYIAVNNKVEGEAAAAAASTPASALVERRPSHGSAAARSRSNENSNLNNNDNSNNDNDESSINGYLNNIASQDAQSVVEEQPASATATMTTMTTTTTHTTTTATAARGAAEAGEATDPTDAGATTVPDPPPPTAARSQRPSGSSSSVSAAAAAAVAAENSYKATSTGPPTPSSRDAEGVVLTPSLLIPLRRSAANAVEAYKISSSSQKEPSSTAAKLAALRGRLQKSLQSAEDGLNAELQDLDQRLAWHQRSAAWVTSSHASLASTERDD